MKVLSKVAFWIVVLALLLIALVALLPSGPHADGQSYVGCTYDFKSGVQCFNFVGSDLVEYILGVGVLFMLAPTLGWVLFFLGPPSWLAVVAVLIMATYILAIAYIISLIKKVLRREAVLAAESNAREFKTAKILIIILLVATAGFTVVYYAFDPLGLRTPLTVSETTGKAPLTVRITGPAKLLALKDTGPCTIALDNTPYKVDDKNTCGFRIDWMEMEDWKEIGDHSGASRGIYPNTNKEGGYATLLSYTFTKPGWYKVRARIDGPRREQILDDLANGADYTIWTTFMLDGIWSGSWNSETIEIHVE